jgi:membrane-associated protease RseP (regulator of RpoE activity)
MKIHRVAKLLVFAALIAGVATIAGAVAWPADPHASAYLGVMVDNVSPTAAASLHLKDGSGAVITGVDQDGPACHAGLTSGDIVTTFNGKPVTGPDEFASAIHATAPGTTVAMTVIREGQSKGVKVTLGDWKQMAAMPRTALSPVGSMGFVPPQPPMPPRMYPDVEVPNFTMLSVRHGIAVEPLSPQLCDFFGVPQNKGVLVRSVDKGSPGAAAGLRAGDVIVRINNETVHDISDWRRAMKGHSGKVSLAIVRDKREQTVEINLPANSSKLQGEDWDSFGQDFTTLALLDPSEIDEIDRQAEDAAKTAVPDLKKQVEQARKQADAAMKAATPEMKKRAEELAKQAAEWQKQSEQIRKEMEKMAPQMERDAIQMADTMKPTAKELADIAREMSKQMKDMEPEFRREMEQFKKDMEQEKREWQDIFKGTDPKHL